MMDSSNIADLASAFVAFLALVVSLISLAKTSKFNARQIELADTTDRLNRLLIERESSEGLAAKRADLSANLFQAGKNSYRLRVFNRGKGTAQNVRLLDMQEEGRSLLLEGDVTRKFPVPILEQHQSIELIAAVFMGSVARAHIKLLWDDETGQNHEKELTPSL